MAVLVRYAEIGLKGKNRERYERALMRNIELCLRANKVPFEKVWKMYGRIIVETENPCTALRAVFGIASFSHAVRTGSTIENAFEAARDRVESLSGNDSFRVSCQRLDKTFPLTAQETCAKLGELLKNSTKAKVKMENPTVNIALEIINGEIYVLADRIEGPGGMPVGSQGSVVVLVEGDNAVLSALLMLKRGCSAVLAVKNKIDCSLLDKFSCGSQVKTEKISDIKELDSIAKKHGALAVVLSDSFGILRDIGLKVLVLRPLSGFSQEEIAHERTAFENLSGPDKN